MKKTSKTSNREYSAALTFRMKPEHLEKLHSDAKAANMGISLYIRWMLKLQRAPYGLGTNGEQEKKVQDVR